jgi:hypothetical protein
MVPWIDSVVRSLIGLWYFLAIKASPDFLLRTEKTVSTTVFLMKESEID